MKTKSIIQSVFTCLALAIALPAMGDDEAKEVEAGKRGGRLLATESPRPEFFVEKDHKVSVKFYDKDGNVVAPADQQVTVIASGKEKKKLQLEKKDDALVSAEPLPEGDGYNLVVQVRANADSRPENFRFTFLNHICGGTCGNPEYACTCDD
ncbi:MAG: hypothetical protein P1U58_11055 [Verrucomicrobiales bacterium]|nr:hypothetical protein [Verrucomicrobiales bacterium]